MAKAPQNDYHRLVPIMPSQTDADADADADVERSGGDPHALAAAAVLFRGFGDPSRLAILSHLMLGEHNVRELTEHLELAQSTVSEHLRCLLDCGLVQVRAHGRASVYSLAVEPQMRELLMAAERLLAATGDQVLLCPRYRRTADA